VSRDGPGERAKLREAAASRGRWCSCEGGAARAPGRLIRMPAWRASPRPVRASVAHCPPAYNEKVGLAHTTPAGWFSVLRLLARGWGGRATNFAS
jgi:hypothetical protein